MRFAILLFLLIILPFGCRSEKKQEKENARDTAVEALPENLGDKTAPTEVRALKGAKEVKRRFDEQQKEDSKVLKESDQ
jgi:hypothetical protein